MLVSIKGQRFNPDKVVRLEPTEHKGTRVIFSGVYDEKPEIDIDLDPVDVMFIINRACVDFVAKCHARALQLTHPKVTVSSGVDKMVTAFHPAEEVDDLFSAMARVGADAFNNPKLPEAVLTFKDVADNRRSNLLKDGYELMNTSADGLQSLYGKHREDGFKFCWIKAKDAVVYFTPVASVAEAKCSFTTHGNPESLQLLWKGVKPKGWEERLKKPRKDPNCDKDLKEPETFDDLYPDSTKPVRVVRVCTPCRYKVEEDLAVLKKRVEDILFVVYNNPPTVQTSVRITDRNNVLYHVTLSGNGKEASLLQKHLTKLGYSNVVIEGDGSKPETLADLELTTGKQVKIHQLFKGQQVQIQQELYDLKQFVLKVIGAEEGDSVRVSVLLVVNALNEVFYAIRLENLEACEQDLREHLRAAGYRDFTIEMHNCTTTEDFDEEEEN